MRFATRTPVTAALVVLALAGHGRAADLLVPEGSIALPGVAGRIDHMAIDAGRNRLLVAELGNGTVEAVDLAAGRSVKRIAGLHEPQGVSYAAKPDIVLVASAGDGTVRFFHGADLMPAGSVALGDDADNIRIDPASANAVVGYGNGGLALIDPARGAKIAEIPLPAHPESFRIDPAAGHTYVNLPDAHRIAVIDLAARRQIASWPTGRLRANFPMALADGGALVAVAFRSPATLVLYDARTGAVAANLDTCHDADDVFFDGRRRRLYVSCGEGVVDIIAADAAGWRSVARVATSSGARTSLFVPEQDRLYVAARAGWFGSEAAILVFRPMP